ncbi:unnamed protein product [Durusdinium trenchii]|uniref:Beta-ketoacyl synthase-like N-terminal domain-containing protein n=1 Tax=Durusdinium trenchii TaxID=1381693 RepID=A0ABP0NYL1_9DINO
MGKKAGYLDPDDEKLKQGQQQLIQDSAKWKGPSHKERREKEVKKAMKNREKPERASWKQQATGWFFIVFICGVGFVSFLFTMSDILIGNGIVNLDVQDTNKLKTVLFGGDPWLIYCVNDDTVNYRLPEVLEQSARSLYRSLGVSVGVLRCWEETASGRSVAQRFKLNLKPPLSFVVANGNKPRVLPLTGISKSEHLEKRIRPALSIEAVRVDALKKWSSCTSRRACLVVGHKNTAQKDTAMNVVKPLQEKFRALKVVTLDTAFWQLKLEESLMRTRSKERHGADVMCLTREDVPGGNSTFGGAFLWSLDSSSAQAFMQNCVDHRDMVPLKSSPKIKARPSPKPKTVVPDAPKPKPSKPKPKPKDTKKSASARVDQVGSRESLESEEPLFEAVEEDEEEEEEEEGRPYRPVREEYAAVRWMSSASKTFAMGFFARGAQGFGPIGGVRSVKRVGGIALTRMPAELLVSEIGHNLRFKGHCVVKLGVDEDVLEQASDEAVDLKRAGKLQASALPSRADDETTPPQQLIDALLGPEGTNEYCRLDQLPEEGDEDVEVGPELLGLNRRITKIAGASIAFCASEGYDNCSKSGEYLVRGGDYSDEVAELTEESCSEWLSLLNRARLMLVYIFGEGRGQLELLPFDEDSDSVEIATEPDMLVILRADQMHHKHQSSRGTFSILSWIMAAENSTTRGWTGGLSRTFGVTIPTARELVEWTQNRLKELLETEALDKDADIPRDWQLMMRHSFFRNNRSPVAVRGEAGHMPTTNNNRVLWDAINQGSDFVTDVPYHRWDHELYYDADPNCWMQAGRNRYFAARLEERKRDLGILQRS